MICLDTTVIIDFLNGKKEALSLIEKNEDDITTTEISVFETFLGIYNKKTISQREEEKAKELFNSIEILPMKKSTGILAAKILTELEKNGHIIGQNDCMTAAIMIKNDINRIITSDKKHFSKIKNLKVISY